MNIKLTAIICTRDRSFFLDKCIRSLLHQSVGHDYFEILVVDNGSTDDTSNVLAKYQHLKNFRSVFEPVAGLSRARNLGWKQAQAPLVGYIDDDAVTDSCWVASILEVEGSVSPLPAWIGGPIHLEWEEPAPEWVNEELRIPLGYVDWGSKARILTVSERLGGGNSVYRKDVLQEVGGFDERLGRNPSSLLSGEETQLQKKIESAGGNLYYHPGIKIYHYVGAERLKPRWFYRRYYWGGVSDAFMKKTLASLESKEEIPETVSINDDSAWLRVLRLLENLISASGLFVSTDKKIHSRVYLSYVLGRIIGLF